MRVRLLNKVHTIDAYFTSFCIDMSQLLGKDWWSSSLKKTFSLSGKESAPKLNLDSSKLRNYTKQLTPAILRIGGNLADKVSYGEKLPGYTYHIPFSVLESLDDFVSSLHMKLFITLNAGKGPRENKKWTSKNAEILLQYLKKTTTPIAGFEFGNEPNAFILSGLRLTGKQYAEEYSRCRNLVKQYYPNSPLTGCSSAFWPYIGEGYPLMKSFLKHAKDIDVISWHFYPQQSKRSPVATRRARKKTLLSRRTLNSVAKWHAKIAKNTTKYHHPLSFWMTETGGAQAGGQPGITDVFVGSLWWLDELGTLAQLQYEKVMRQTLVGGDYGLLDNNYDPNPDYWATLLWKKFMDGDVYHTNQNNAKSTLRIYAHRNKKYTTLLAINIGKKWRHIDIDKEAEVYAITSPSLYSKDVMMNGFPIEQEWMPQIVTHTVRIQPTSYVFIRMKN
jgi:heparanase 1